MARNVYLIITDTHFGNLVTNSRVDYRNEVYSVERCLLEIAIKYKKSADSVTALFLGDVFHNGYKDVTQALLDKDFIIMWKLKVGEVFSVVGNHELTYYKDNPFYTLVSKIESETLQSVQNRVWTPLGSMNTIRVVDTLSDGDTTFYFNHFGTGIQKPRAPVSIGLFHQELMDPQIKTITEKERGRRVYGHTTEFDAGGIFKGYSHCFFGHLHGVYGIWKSDGTYLHYLASLGRTNEQEVQNDFLQRNVPAVVVEDGHFKTVEENFIGLLSRDVCINEEIVEKHRQHYQKQKEIIAIRNYTPIGDDPVENLYRYFLEEPEMIRILDDLKESEEDSRLHELKAKMRRFGLGN